MNISIALHIVLLTPDFRISLSEGARYVIWIHSQGL